MAIEPLDTTIHDRNTFTCGVDSVDRYFHRVAREAADRNTSQTYVLVPEKPRADPCEVIGYYTLLPHNYIDADLDPTTAKALKVTRERAIPMILLGRLGIGVAHQKKGVGPTLLRDAMRRALSAALTVGAVALITDPHDERADGFYRKFGFQTLVEGHRRLFIQTKQLKVVCPDIVEAFKAQPAEIFVRVTTQNYTA